MTGIPQCALCRAAKRGRGSRLLSFVRKATLEDHSFLACGAVSKAGVTGPPPGAVPKLAF